MDDGAKFELEQLTGLYKFYLDAYIKGIAFFLAIASFIAKTALDSLAHRVFFGLAGMTTSTAVLIPLIFSIWHERHLCDQFRQLAKMTATTPVSTAPFRILIVGTSALWLLVFAAWIYIVRDSN